MPIVLQDIAACLVAASLSYLIWSRQAHKKAMPHPPGPPGIPFIGNLRDIPPDPAWNTYLSWSQKYGSDIVRINVFGSNIVIVNSLDAATELLERRSMNYSDRNDMVMLNELCGYGWNLPFQRYGNEWRDGRRAFHQNLGPESIKQHRPVMLAATRTFLCKLARGKSDVTAELRHLAGSEILKTAYGIDVLPENDPYIETAEHALQTISATVNAGSYLVDILPVLKYVPAWFPGAQFQREATAWKYHVCRMKDEPWKAIKRRLAAGELPECAATSLLEAMDRNPKIGYTELAVQSMLASMYTGGSDTTVSALGSFFLAMVLNPEIQYEAQRQVDRVCAGRLPDFSDIHDIPFVDALVKESLRWHPVVPLNVPHRSTADDIYNGYYLPKDTLVVANNWAILHDANVYPDPLTFKPERFLKDGKMNPDVQDPALACFGFGRRICPGRFMAYESMWITIASTLATVTIRKVKNADGTYVVPKEDYIEGFLCHPKPFECDILPRSAEHRALLDAATADE